MSRGRRNRVRLGKNLRKYNLYRNLSSGYDDYGEAENNGWELIEIVANIQGALVYNKMRILDTGELSKDCISIRSNQRIYKSRTSTNGLMLQADIVEWEGAYYEVREIISYTNLPMTAHDEVLAVKLEEDQINRVLEGFGGGNNETTNRIDY